MFFLEGKTVKVFCGKRDPTHESRPMVWRNGKELTTERSYKVKIVSIAGFWWGDTDRGSCQLALALLLEAVGSVRRSLGMYRQFCKDVVAKFGDVWVMTSEEILDWVVSESFDKVQMEEDDYA